MVMHGEKYEEEVENDNTISSDRRTRSQLSPATLPARIVGDKNPHGLEV